MRKISNFQAIGRPSLWIFVLLALLSSARPAHASEDGLEILSVIQQDLNGDGRPDQTLIESSFATELDRIYVLDQGNDMRTSTDWREASDFNNDIWMYDIGGDDSMQLIVVYLFQDGQAIANVYDDRNGDGQVSYEKDGTFVRILESSYPTARFISDSNWFLPNSLLNLNLKIQLDGPIPTFDRVPADFTNNWMEHDGLIDAEFEEVAGPDGVARYAVKRLLTSSPPEWGFERTGLFSNEGRYRTGLHERAFFPFLPIPIDRQDPSNIHLRYFDLPPTLIVDWQQGNVLGVGLDGYPIGHGYHFNDSLYVIKGQVNDVAFESPQAYYDLANNHDEYAEMHVRFFTHPPRDPSMWSFQGMSAVPWQSISYDWNLFNPGTLRWDFKVGLGGNYTIDSIVRFRDFGVRMVPFEEFPYWITEREWKLTTFVAREGEGYESSEGIYEWQADTGDDPEKNPDRAIKAREATHGYMLGINPSTPDEFFQNTHPGFRAERRLASPIKPVLYFSPIDQKLHLRGAEAGVWTIDENSLIRYADLDGDGYLDKWQYFENKRLLREFYLVKDYLIYRSEDGIILKNRRVSLSEFETLPPRNHEEWQEMRQRLATNRPDFSPGNFNAMLAQFSGDVWQIDQASLRGFRPDGDGFRFILELQPDFRVLGDGVPKMRDLQPGSYVVNYQEKFTIIPLTPPALSASLAQVKSTQLQISSIPVMVRNDGLEDVARAEIELWTTSPEGDSAVAAIETVQLLAQETVKLTLEWVPPSAGGWTLTPKIRRLNGQAVPGEALKVSVLPAQAPAPRVLVPASASAKTLPLILIGLIALASIASLVMWGQWRITLIEERDDIS